MSFQLYVNGKEVGRVNDILGPMPEPDDPNEPEDAFPYIRPYTSSVGFEINPYILGPGVFDDLFSTDLVPPREIKIYGVKHPAWWGRLKNKLLGRKPPRYLLVQTNAVLTELTHRGAPDGITLTAKIITPITLGGEPMSRLEAAWKVICDWVKSL